MEHCRCTFKQVAEKVTEQNRNTDITDAILLGNMRSGSRGVEYENKISVFKVDRFEYAKTTD